MGDAQATEQVTLAGTAEDVAYVRDWAAQHSGLIAVQASRDLVVVFRVMPPDRIDGCHP